jgi:trehalose 6-phosphate phosphatase
VAAFPGNEPLEKALAELSVHPQVLVALDFDGTLAPLQDDPENSRMLPEAREAVDALTDIDGVHVSLVTGRAFENIMRVADPHPDWFLVGSHGIEVVAPHERDSYASPQLVPDGLLQGFHQIAQDIPGPRIEVKPFGLAIHTRGLGADVAAAAEAATRLLCDEWPDDLVMRSGHGILECAVSDRTKAHGLRSLWEALHVRATLFIGDDVTDEDGFAVLGSGDVGIKVGEGPTKATHRVADPHEVTRVLWHLHGRLASRQPPSLSRWVPTP